MSTPLILAFYYGHGTPVDRLIRTATRSPFSHVELVADCLPPPDATWWECRAISSSARDGGVREKTIVCGLDKWVFLPLTGWQPADAWQRAAAQIGKPYDYAGIVMNFTVPLRRHLRDSWFCSELSGNALGLHAPHTMSPGDLYYRVRGLNEAFVNGQLNPPPR